MESSLENGGFASKMAWDSVLHEVSPDREGSVYAARNGGTWEDGSQHGAAVDTKRPRMRGL
jgi:hypothetical protein